LEASLGWVQEHEGVHEILNLGESRTVALTEMISVIGEELGIEPRIRRLPEQPGDVDRTFADISKARKILGYDPQWDFREGIRTFLEWLEAQDRM
jgi:UDP-glucuronate 4-epimerase